VPKGNRAGHHQTLTVLLPSHTMTTRHKRLAGPARSIFLAILLTASGYAAPPRASYEAMRFAAEGRADVESIRLACGRSANVTVAALAELTSPEATGQGIPVSLGQRNDPQMAAIQILHVIEIPEVSRGRLRLRFETNDPSIRRSVADATNFLSRTVAARWLPKSEIRVRALGWNEPRAYAAGLGGLASIHLQSGRVDIGTAVHELAHHIEGDHQFVLEASKRFLARRARGGAPERLRDLTGLDYGHDEVAVRANWTTRGGSHYSGKFYGPSLKDATATELISMGLERLDREPVAFFREDADYFLFLLLTLQSTK
jgi:hypothetical protein